MPEAPAVRLLIDGLQQAYARDDELLEQGIVLFEGLYRGFATSLVRAQSKRRPARVPKAPGKTR